ncbi:hypothetical protein GQ44DRAFT_608465, partial [Phaeosphaeriaceae sp. PMI808]
TITMVTQRRYSVTGQTPPDDAEAMQAEKRSPKLQALDTNVPSTRPCRGRGRKISQAGTTIVRTSSKRSATQLPSPSSPSHELPPKVARFRLAHNDDADDSDLDTDTDDSDVFRDKSDHDDYDDHLLLGSQATSMPSTPNHSRPSSVCRLQTLQLYSPRESSEDDCMEDLALSPSHSRNHSLDCTHLGQNSILQQDWAAYQQSSNHLQHIHNQAQQAHDTHDTHDTYAPPTLLTLPPEIRHQIYRNCEELIFKQPLLYCIATAFDKIQHPLAAVSRQVRSEALAIFYSYNTWTVKVEFKMMYEGFQHWIIRLGDGADSLRLVDLSVRGTLFKPKRAHTQSVLLHGQLIQITPGITASGREELYSPPDGDASFRIDLSEKYVGGRVQLVRNDGTQEAGEKGRVHLAKMVETLWEKRRLGTLNGQDWVNTVDSFITFIGGWAGLT